MNLDVLLYSNAKNLSSINFHPYYCVILCILHIAFFTVTIQPFTSRYLGAHQRYPRYLPYHTLQRHFSHAFSISTRGIHKSLFFARYFSCHRRTLSVRFVRSVRLFCRAPSCHKSELDVVNFHPLQSRIVRGSSLPL